MGELIEPDAGWQGPNPAVEATRLAFEQLAGTTIETSSGDEVTVMPANLRTYQTSDGRTIAINADIFLGPDNAEDIARLGEAAFVQTCVDELVQALDKDIKNGALKSLRDEL